MQTRMSCSHRFAIGELIGSQESAALGIAATADREQARLVDRLLRGLKSHCWETRRRPGQVADRGGSRRVTFRTPVLNWDAEASRPGISGSS